MAHTRINIQPQMTQFLVQHLQAFASDPVFMGNLLHSVNPVQSSKPRISLICEQYTLEPNRLESIPEFEILSGANIKRY
ncbi:MAG: hypothetical protein JHC73_00660 [Dolichospermum sp.]|nr:hypothetical protein [Dolichospermum sp.]